MARDVESSVQQGIQFPDQGWSQCPLHWEHAPGPAAKPSGLPRWLRQQRMCLQCRRPRFDPWVGKVPWGRKWQPTPAFLPGESHGQRRLLGDSPRGHKELDTTELMFTFHTKNWRQKGKGTADEMLRWHHQLDGQESEQTPGGADGQGSLVRCSPWGRRESGVADSAAEQQQQHTAQCSPSTRLPTVWWITLATISRCMSVGEFNMWNVSMITNGVDFALKRPVFLSQPQSFLTSLSCPRNENNTANCPRGFCAKWSFEYRVFLRQFTSHGVLNRVIGQEVLWFWD